MVQAVVLVEGVFRLHSGQTYKVQVDIDPLCSSMMQIFPHFEEGDFFTSYEKAECLPSDGGMDIRMPGRYAGRKAVSQVHLQEAREGKPATFGVRITTPDNTEELFTTDDDLPLLSGSIRFYVPIGTSQESESAT